jgi:hypothetical protein
MVYSFRAMISLRSLLCRAAGGDHSINLTAHGESQQPLAEVTRFQRRAVDTASQVADTVRMTDTEDGCQRAQRTGRSLTAKPRGEASGDAPPRSIRPTGASGTT